MHIPSAVVPIFLFVACAAGVAVALLVLARVVNPARPGGVKRMPYESGMDPIHDTRRRFDVRFHLLAIAFLVFDVELLFLYPWAVAMRPAVVEAAPAAAAEAPLGIDAAVAAGLVQDRDLVFGGAMVFVALLAVGFIYDWRKGVFRWR
jgi:NADH-quinone oxidoreductase subunit A